MTCNAQQIAIRATTSLNKANLWHLRLGHINQHKLKKIQTMAKGIDSFNEKEITLCQPCIEGKQHKEKFPKQTTQRTTELLNLVHSDICGPIQVGTYSGCIYFISFIDDLSRYYHVYSWERNSHIIWLRL